MSSSDAPSLERSGLECMIAFERVIVPIETLDQVIEYETSAPPPLAKPWFAGVGVSAGRIVASLTLCPSGVPQPRVRARKGILMLTPGGLPWALEVDKVRAIVTVTLSNEPVLGRLDCPGFWLKAATLRDGSSALWLDSQSVSRSVTGTMI